MNLILFIARFLLISRNGATTFVTVVYNRKFHNKYLTHIILHKIASFFFFLSLFFENFPMRFFFLEQFQDFTVEETWELLIVLLYSSRGIHHTLETIKMEWN